MRRFLILLLGGVFCFMLSACNDAGAPKIGVMDMNKLLRDSAPGKAGIQYIEQQQAGLQKRMEEIQDRLEKNPKDEAAQQELQKLFITAQQQVQGDGQAVVGALLEAIQKVADQFRKQHGYLAIVRVEALDSYDPSLDITDDMMKEVDKLNLDFKSILAAQSSGPMVMELQDNESASEQEAAKTADNNEDVKADRGDQQDKPDTPREDTEQKKTTTKDSQKKK